MHELRQSVEVLLSMSASKCDGMEWAYLQRNGNTWGWRMWICFGGLVAVLQLVFPMVKMMFSFFTGLIGQLAGL
jgi:hypothetical protein